MTELWWGLETPLSEKLQLDGELTLITAIAKVRQAEEVKKQQPLLQGETPAAGGKKPDVPVGGCPERKAQWKTK